MSLRRWSYMKQLELSLRVAILSALFIVLLSTAQSTSAQDRAKPGLPVRSLGSLLNADGTLKLASGFSGSVDAKGWKMVAPGTGQPRFIRQGLPPFSDDEKWADGFGVSGLDGDVSAVAVVGTDVYVGGNFTKAGNVSANHIARWDGTRWHDLGGGLTLEAGQAFVRAIAVSGTDVYAGGFFTSAGGGRAQNIAKWDGNSWSPLGDGRDRLVLAIAVSGKDVYVGGTFAGVIARWDGYNWTSLSGNMVGGCNLPACVASVNAIAVSGRNVYVAGNFTSIGGVSTGNVARWTGSSWTSVGGGVRCETADCVNSIAVNGTDVFVGGYFAQAGDVSTNSIAKWDGSSWSALGSGISGQVLSIATSGTNVFASGSFETAGDTTVKNIARWDGAGWSPLDSGINDNQSVQVKAIAVMGGDLYAGGRFNVASGTGADRIAKFNGTRWSGLVSEPSNGLNDEVFAIAVNGKDVYVGGYFTLAGGLNARGIARWDGSTWYNLGGGLDGSATLRGSNVASIAIKGNEIYVGGDFYSIGGVPALGIARWDGTKWSPLGDGVQGCSGFECESGVRAITIVGNDIYVGGTFTKAGDVITNGIAKWNGEKWSGLGGGITDQPPYSGISAVVARGNDLYVGGNFNSIGGRNIAGIARWDGQEWSQLGDGLECRPDRFNCRPAVYTLSFVGARLYAGGSFEIAGKATVNNIAVWDGKIWTPLGSGADGSVAIITAHGEDIYIGGAFRTINGGYANRVARWDGANWSSLGTGLDGWARALALSGDDVYVGGLFSTAGGKVSYNIGRWSGPPFRPILPRIASASTNRKQLIVSGEKFDTGAVILNNAEQQKTANDDLNPTTILIAKKSGKRIKTGDRVQVRNPDGAVSLEFTFNKTQ
jgi:hypothetical protein